MPVNRKSLALTISLFIGFASLTGIILMLADSADVIKQSVTLKADADKTNEKQHRQGLEQLKKIDSQSIHALQELADIDFKNEQFLKAAQQYGELYKLSPLDSNALFMQARSLYLGGEFEPAQKLFLQPALADIADTGAYRARLLMADQKAGEALILLNEHRKRFPDHYASALLQADIYLINKQTETARQAYTALLDKPEFAAAAHFGIAQVLQSEGKSDEVIQWMKKAPQSRPNLQLDTARAELWRNVGVPEESRKLYDTLISHYGPRTELIIANAELVAAIPDKDAVQALKRKINAVNAISLAARHYLDAISSYLNKDYPASLQSLSWAEKALGKRDLFRLIEADSAAFLADSERFDNAIREMRINRLSEKRRMHLKDNLLRHTSNWLNRGNANFSLQLVNVCRKLDAKDPAVDLMLARARLLLNDYAATVRLSRELIKSGLYKDASLELLARALIETNQFTEAETALNELQSITADKPVSYYWAGISAYRQEKFDAAEKHLRKSYLLGSELKSGAALVDVYLQTKNFPAVKELSEHFLKSQDKTIQAIGTAYQAGSEIMQGNNEQAAILYEKAFKLDNTRIVYKLSALDRYIDAKNYIAADRVVHELQKIKPDDQIIDFKQAYLLQITGQNEKAITTYEKLITRYPNWAITLVNLSELLAADEKRIDEAVRLARQASNLAPNWAAAQFNLAKILDKAGQHEEARDYAQKALLLKPDMQEAQSFLQKKA